jgi:hypothetical protein
MVYLWKSVLFAASFVAVNWALDVSGLGFTSVEPLSRYLAAETGFPAQCLLLLQTGLMAHGVFAVAGRVCQAAAPAPRRPNYWLPNNASDA